mgnify:FL=1|tara:strand:+ start:29 stop:559 length:531 start_codon:yes stop_codon:yes gene_type:complete
MYKVNNKPLPLDRAFTLGDIQYPSNWLRLAKEEEKTALGISWEAEAVRADDRFYWSGDIANPKALEDREEVDEDGNPLYVQEWDAEAEVMTDTDERMVTKGLKSNWIAQVKDTAGKMLATTDWMVIRKAERAVAIPDATVAARAAIVAEADRLEAAINTCGNVDALIAVVSTQNWE